MNFRKVTQLLLSICLLVACDSNKYTVIGVFPDTSYDGEKLYIFDSLTNDKVDSAIVKKNKVTFSGSARVESVCSYIQTDFGLVEFFIEKGETLLDFKDLTVEGGFLNQEKLRFNQYLSDFFFSSKARLDSVRSDTTVSRQEADLNTRLFYEKEILPQQKKDFERLITKHSDNVLGILILYEASSILSDEELLTYIALLDPIVQKHSVIEELKESKNNILRSKEGELYIDLDVKNKKGEDVSLSTYIGKGKHTLVSFLATWSVSCLSEISYLKDIYFKYSDKDFDLLNVLVWDKQGEAEQWSKEMDLPWIQLFDKKSKAMDLYAIEGVPYSILFSPKGKIIARGERIENLDTRLEDLLTSAL